VSGTIDSERKISLARAHPLLDLVGRRPILLIGTIGVALATLASGLSKSFTSAIIARFFGSTTYFYPPDGHSRSSQLVYFPEPLLLCTLSSVKSLMSLIKQSCTLFMGYSGLLASLLGEWNLFCSFTINVVFQPAYRWNVVESCFQIPKSIWKRIFSRLSLFFTVLHGCPAFNLRLHSGILPFGGGEIVHMLSKPTH
jgi:MFS family permease